MERNFVQNQNKNMQSQSGICCQSGHWRFHLTSPKRLAQKILSKRPSIRNELFIKVRINHKTIKPLDISSTSLVENRGKYRSEIKQDG